VTAAPPAARRSDYWLTRFVLLRLLGFVYAAAFLSAALQLVPLIGSAGLLPLPAYLDRVTHALGSRWNGFVELPSLFWIGSSDAALRAVSWSGFVGSCVVLAGFANSLLLAALWALYMSIVHVGQDWYGYGWEIQLLETGFLAIFLVPLLDARPFPRRAPPLALIVLFRWLAFRIMLGAGLIKIRGDSCWRDLTALYYHFETQPIPNPLSRFLHFLPRALLRAGVVFNHLAELVAPWFVFGPRSARRIAGVLIVAFQLVLISSGNLSFLNWLTIVPAIACFDDGAWARVLPRALVTRAARADREALPSPAMQRASWAVAALIALLSIPVVVNLASPHQIMNTSFTRFDLVNTYGAFGSVGRERWNVVFEGTADDRRDPDARWLPYLYRALPVALDRRPVVIAPFQPRLDWQMWFAAMASPNEYPWTIHLVWKLLHGDPGALSLFATNPFPEKPPRYVRAVLYRYAFARPDDPDGRFWTRDEIGEWLPPLSADDPQLVAVLRSAGWIPTDRD
jgi:hypothetical protein